MNKQPGFIPIIIIVGIALISALAGGGGYYMYQQDQQRKEGLELSNDTNDIPDDSLPVVSGDIKTIDQIRSIAEPLAAGAKIVNIELENEDAGLIYKVKLDNGIILFFNAKTGQQVFDPSDDSELKQTSDKEEQDEIPDNFIASITLAQARSIAEAKRPGKVVKKIEMEMEEGVGIYSVRFTDSGRVDVNATNGAVMRVEAGDEEGEN